MKTVGVVCVRMGSSRLPGKALRTVVGKPLLGHLLDRARLARTLDGIVVATSERPENDVIAAFCATLGVPCFRGSEDDVLGRMLGALRSQHAEIGVNLFGDGPMIDPAVIDLVVEIFMKADGAFELVGNDLVTTWPPGMEVQAFSVAALADAERRCDSAPTREHGTLFLRQNPQQYRLHNVEATGALRRPDLSLEVDSAEDLLVVAPLAELISANPSVGLGELIAYLDAHPDIAGANREVPRRWKQFRQAGGGSS